MEEVVKLEESSQIENLIFKHPIVQTLLSEVSKSEEYDVNIGIPIRKQFEDNGKLIIAGYASVEIIDSQKELIPLEVLKEAWNKFSENEDFMIGTLMHSNIPVIKILKEYKDSKGELWKSGVDDTGLFIVAVVNDTIEKGKQARELIEKGALAGFSIGGEALASSVHCEGKCYTRIDKMELHEIAVVDKPANKASVFTIVKRLKENKSEEKMSKSISKALGPEDFKHMTIKQMVSKLKEWVKERKDLGYKSPSVTEEQKKDIELASNINSIKHAIGERMSIEKIVIDSSKLDKALDFISKRVERRGNKWCVVHCRGPKAGQVIRCFSTKEQADKMHRAIMVNKQAEKPPKAEWDRCEGKARGIPSIKNPAAFCGNLWFNDRSKWNAFVKVEKCGCPVNKTITTKSINRLDKSLSLLVNNQKKKPNKKVNK